MLRPPTREEASDYLIPEYSDYVPDLLLVKIEEDVTANVPDITTASAASMEKLTLPSQVEEPFKALRQKKAFKDIVPVFAHSIDATGLPAPYTSLAAAFTTSVRDTEADDLRGFNLLRVSKSADTAVIEKNLNKTKGIEYAHRVPARWLAVRKSTAKKPAMATGKALDPSVNLQWNLRAIQWFNAFQKPDTQRIKVGVLDSGVDKNHPDLKGVVRAYYYDGATDEDIIGHGTHVAGIIGAKGNNAFGVSGICRCDLYAWKIMGDQPASDGRHYVDQRMYLRALNAARSSQIQIINLSISGRKRDRTEELLFKRCHDAGVTVIAAMGNEFQRGNPVMYPAAHPYVVAVGATDEINRRAVFSNTGKHIDISAPGTNIISTLPMKKSAVRTKENDTGYGTIDGTSMSTPHVTAAAAMVIAKHPDFDPAQVARRLKQTATKLPQLKKEEIGAGLLNLKAAL
jgi:subtilisin family serine protease